MEQERSRSLKNVTPLISGVYVRLGANEAPGDAVRVRRSFCNDKGGGRLRYAYG